IWSEVTSSDGSTALICSCVTYPRFFASLIIFLTSASERSSSGRGVSGVASTTSFSGASSFWPATGLAGTFTGPLGAVALASTFGGTLDLGGVLAAGFAGALVFVLV